MANELPTEARRPEASIELRDEAPLSPARLPETDRGVDRSLADALGVLAFLVVGILVWLAVLSILPEAMARFDLSEASRLLDSFVVQSLNGSPR